MIVVAVIAVAVTDSFGVCVIAIRKLIVIVCVEVEYPRMIINNLRIARIDNLLRAVWIVIIIPVCVGTPGIIPVQAIVVAVAIPRVIKIIIIRYLRLYIKIYKEKPNEVYIKY